MTLKEYKLRISSPLRQATLLFLVQNDEILLAMKKRGFGKGRWNGVGGKIDAGESVEDAAIRETQEEIGVTPKSLEHIATLDFYFPLVPQEKKWNQQVVVYFCHSWEEEAR